MVKIDCICPLTAGGEARHPHGDEVELRERLDFRQATAARNAIGIAKAEDADIDAGEVLAILTEQYLIHGVCGWTLVDAKGKRVEVTKPNIRELLLSHPEAAAAVGDAADAVYGPAVLLPLLQRASTSSPPSPTGGSTSAMTDSRNGRRKPSRRSSTTTSRMDGIATTSQSLAGVSS